MTMSISPASSSATGQWQPVSGSRTKEFVKKKTSGPRAMSGVSLEIVESEATEILAHCVDPKLEQGSAAVLAVGYVQSGKTLSFTTVTALARDNGYGMVIVLAGTTNNLKDQSEDRLSRDLGLDDYQRDWRHFDNPDISGTALEDIRKTVGAWQRHRDGKAVADKPAVLVTVLKHAKRMNDAAKLFARIPMLGVPVLVIDDESDQASLNTNAHKNLLNGTADESGTYEAVLALRDSLPHHSYLQYTATPQANLLVAATDILDPSFAKVISSGTDYTGGKVFFQDLKNELVRKVPDSEIFDPADPFTEPPANLQEALKVFLLGITAEQSANVYENRSMMVQAHQNTAPHKLYNKWVSSLIAAWAAGLSSNDVVARADIESEFSKAYVDLGKTVKNMLPLAELLDRMAETIEEVKVVVVNSTKEAEKVIKWKSWNYWILIGGQKLDRGFTVEGLTVTYMPRPVSANADVLQQRARFFGYKEKYIKYCRVYLVQDSIDAFSGYVEDEEFFRESLKKHEGSPLSTWHRDFVLHERLSRPTRANVVGRKQRKLPLRKGWTWPKDMHIDRTALSQNRERFLTLMSDNKGALVDSTIYPSVIDNRSSTSRNLVLPGLGLLELNEFLLKLRFPAREDSLLMGAIELALSRTLDKDPAAVGDIVFMSGLQVAQGRGRALGVLRQNIHIGMNPSGATGAGVIYSGDREVVNPTRFTVQLRLVKLSSPSPKGAQAFDSVPWLAAHFPTNIANHAWLESD